MPQDNRPDFIPDARETTPTERPEFIPDPEMPSIWSGSYQGPTGTVAPGESLPHAVTRQLLGGVGRLGKALYEVSSFPADLKEGVAFALGGIPGLISYRASGGHLETAKKTLEQARAGHIPETIGYGAATVLPGIGPWAAGMGERAASGDVGAASEFGAATLLPKIQKVAGKVAAKVTLPPVDRATNLAAALEMGGKAEKGVTVYEKVVQPIIEDFRAEGVRQGKTLADFEGRRGYAAAREIAEGVRTNYDEAYHQIVQGVADQPAGAAAEKAAQYLGDKLAKDAALLDELTKAKTKAKTIGEVERIQRAILNSHTIGELDAQRIALNRLSSRYQSKTGAQQYQSPILQEALDTAADGIRNALYPEIAKAYRGSARAPALTESALRNLQRRHGAAIKLDNMMEVTANYISSAASAEGAPGTIAQRLRGSAYRATMSPRHAVGGMIERIWPPSEVELFNTRMRRVVRPGK
jgi:hypothetical protein